MSFSANPFLNITIIQRLEGKFFLCDSCGGEKELVEDSISTAFDIASFHVRNSHQRFPQDFLDSPYSDSQLIVNTNMTQRTNTNDA